MELLVVLVCLLFLAREGNKNRGKNAKEILEPQELRGSLGNIMFGWTFFIGNLTTFGRS